MHNGRRGQQAVLADSGLLFIIGRAGTGHPHLLHPEGMQCDHPCLIDCQILFDEWLSGDHAHCGRCEHVGADIDDCGESFHPFQYGGLTEHNDRNADQQADDAPQKTAMGGNCRRARRAAQWN